MATPIGTRIRLAGIAALCAAFLHPAWSAEVDLGRELFVAAFDKAERGDWSAVDALTDTDRELLERYVLWPDLRAAYLKAAIRQADHVEVETFIERYGALKPGRELRYAYALDLATQGELARYRDIYVAFYQGLGLARLDCLALQAEIDAGRHKRVVERARALWRIGKSQVDECDPVFDYLRKHSLLTKQDYVDRYELAIDAREFRLARWLGKSIDDAHVDAAQAWIAARSNPERYLRSHASRAESRAEQERLAYAAQRLTFRDPDLAHSLWSRVAGRHAFAEDLKLETARHIALWTARDNLPDAYARLTALSPASVDDEVLRWRARTSLRNHAWLALLDDIRQMSAELKSAEEWRYWRAVALENSGQVNAAVTAYESLAEERSYYGFLAADAIDRPYAYAHSDLDVDESLVAALAMRPALVRARELFLVGLDARGRSEWNEATSMMSAVDKRHAAVLADRWGWHSRAIAAVASIGEYDDLTLRYPLPFRPVFEQHAGTARVDAPWAYGIARSESLFMRDIRSGAGAIGVMQLMPSTGRQVAREINLPWAGLDTLTDPDSNIRLGTRYLGRMADRYDGNRVLATAAYNAGPHRVDKWVPEKGVIDARIWIENIPFNETRSYVRRVMTAETIFHWRLTGATRRLSERLAKISAREDAQRLASASR